MMMEQYGRIRHAMVHDRWPNIPVAGEHLNSAMKKVADYIDWLRNEGAEKRAEQLVAAAIKLANSKGDA